MATRTYKAKGSGYTPKNTTLEGGLLDVRDKKLNTLQDYIAKKADYVSVAMDGKLSIPYGKVVKIPEIEADQKQTIEFRVVDTGGHFKGKGYTAIDICVTQQFMTDPTINGMLTLIFND